MLCARAGSAFGRRIRRRHRCTRGYPCTAPGRFIPRRADVHHDRHQPGSLAPKTLPQIVFVTAYDRYAVDAFEVCAVDYLLKPFDEERFQTTLERVRRRHNAVS